MCLKHDLYFFWVSSLTYPNLLGKKGYVVVVVERAGAVLIGRKNGPIHNATFRKAVDIFSH